MFSSRAPLKSRRLCLRLPEILRGVRETALVVGWFLTFIGWLHFVVAVCSLIFDTGGDVGYIFHISGLYIVPGWLLLRFASGL